MNRKEYINESIELLNLHLKVLSLGSSLITVKNLNKDDIDNIRLEVEIIAKKIKNILLKRELLNHS